MANLPTVQNNLTPIAGWDEVPQLETTTLNAQAQALMDRTEALRARHVPDYATLRAYTGDFKSMYVSGYLATAVPSGIAGFFVRDDSDTTTPDNGGTVIEGANGVRWKRVTGSNTISTAWFGLVGDGTIIETAKWQAAINAISSAGGGTLRADPNKVYVTAKLTPKSNVLIDLNGSTLKLAADTNAPILYDGGTTSGTRFGVISGTLDCNQDSNNGVNVVGGVWLTNWTNLTFHDLTITSCARVGLNLHGVRYVHIRNYQFTNSGKPGTYFAYALSLEDGGGFRSQFVDVEGVTCTNVVGFGIHFYRCDDFTARNIKFDTLTYGAHLAIAITFTEANRWRVSNVSCNAVDGDNIEINDSSDGELFNTNVARRRATARCCSGRTPRPTTTTGSRSATSRPQAPCRPSTA